MKTFFKIALLCVLVFLIQACNKEDNYRSMLAGPKTITLYQWKKQDENGSFSKVIHDTTALSDLILWDNDNASINNVTYFSEFGPAGWYYANVGMGEPHKVLIGWYLDYEEKKSLTFWSEDDYGTKFRVTYAMKIKPNGLIHLETVYNTIDGVFSEVIEMKDKK